MKRFASLLLACFFVLAILSLSACGEDTETTGEQTGTDKEKELSLEDTASAAADSLGGDAEAAWAVMLATDTGYSPSQIAQAIEAGKLDQSGDIDGVSPDRSPEGVFSGATGTSTTSGSRTTPAAAVPVLQKLLFKADEETTGPSEIWEIFQEFDSKGKGGAWLTWVLGATAEGYSAEQITEYMTENMPFEDDSPPSLFGVPILLDSEGEIPEPDLPADWPYEGRNALGDLQGDESFSVHNDLTVLVIGLINAGYSEDQMKQITEAIWSDSVGLCSTDGVEGEPQFVPCFIQKGNVVPPENDTQWTPEEILIEQITPVWPVSVADLETGAALDKGEPVTLKLRAFTLSDSGLDDPNGVYYQKVTSEDVTMEVRKDSSGYYRISGSFDIELTQEDDRGQANLSYDPGERWVYAGTFTQGPELNDILGLDVVMNEGPAEGEEALSITIGDFNTEGPGADFTVNHFDADGKHTGEVVKNEDNVVWGTLYFFKNRPPEGQGMFENMAGVTVYWEVVGPADE